MKTETQIVIAAIAVHECSMRELPDEPDRALDTSVRVREKCVADHQNGHTLTNTKRNENQLPKVCMTRRKTEKNANPHSKQHAPITCNT